MVHWIPSELEGYTAGNKYNCPVAVFQTLSLSVIVSLLQSSILHRTDPLHWTLIYCVKEYNIHIF